MKAMKFLIALLICLLPSLAFAGTAHYVDCSASTNGNGSYASPWNNIPSVNSHSFSTGDDVYFKVNTTCTLTADSDRLQVDWSGTSEDRVIIGAYYGNGQFGLNGNSRPIIDGDNNSYPGEYHGLVEVYGSNYDYVTIQDLKVQYSGFYGIMAQTPDNINVDNCYAYRPVGAGITYLTSGGDGVNTGTISNNIVENSGHPDYIGGGAAIEISAGNSDGATTNITVQYNKVFSSKHEGIGLYKKVTNSIVEYNTVYDIRTYHIYIDAGENNTIRYNLSYNLDENERLFPTSGGGYGIAIDNEASRGYVFSGDNEIYGNLVAGQHIGISLACQISLCTGVGVPLTKCKGDFSGQNCLGNTKIYNNTVVDNNYNFRFWEPTNASDNVQIKNNISWTITAGTVHGYNFSPAGVTWSHNLFNDAVSGEAATNSIVNQIQQLKKTSGWRSLEAGSLDGTEFAISSSKAENVGISIESHNDRIAASDYTSEPIMVTISTDSKPSIGAWVETFANTKPGADKFQPGPDWCRDYGPCPEGQGDCDGDAECQSGLICAQDVGADYGWPANRDVCERLAGTSDISPPNGFRKIVKK